MRGQLKRFVELVLHHSIDIQPGQTVLIDVVGRADDWVERLLEEALRMGAVPLLRYMTEEMRMILLRSGSDPMLKQWCETDLEAIRRADAYIGIVAESNPFSMEELSPESYAAYMRLYRKPVQLHAVARRRWLLLRYPTEGMAQAAGMSGARFRQFFYDSCLIDFEAFGESAAVLGRLLGRTGSVRIVSPGTDLRFRLKNAGCFICDGRYNLPDGELFTAPVLDSAEGHIAFNVPTAFGGKVFENVAMTFRNGRVSDYVCSRMQEMEEILSSDEGSKRIGEFGIGLNPVIRGPIRNMLFDEKMSGSVHLALGQAFPMAYNGNESEIHWDFVLCQSAEQGGGQLYFDDVLVRENGRFILPELAALNGG